MQLAPDLPECNCYASWGVSVVNSPAG